MNLANLSNRTKAFALAVFAALVCVAAPQLMAIPVPAAPYDTMGGQAYDIIFNKGYDSGIGYIAAGMMGLYAFMQLKNNWKESAGYGAGATGIALLPGIVTTLGFVF